MIDIPICIDVSSAYIALDAKLLKIFQTERFFPIKKVKKTFFPHFCIKSSPSSILFPIFEPSHKQASGNIIDVHFMILFVRYVHYCIHFEYFFLKMFFFTIILLNFASNNGKIGHLIGRHLSIPNYEACFVALEFVKL